jgi:endonuclease YncB( thermonuclease family)
MSIKARLNCMFRNFKSAITGISIFSLLVIQLLLLNEAVAQKEIVGKVISIADGDTFTMLVEGNKQVKIRLHGIDCPEKGQDYGEVAKKQLSLLLSLHDSVKVIWKSKDRYRRTIGIAYSGRTNINEALLQKGLAWHYLKYDKNPKWSQMEAAARNARLNLWSKPNPVAPWDWREKRD